MEEAFMALERLGIGNAATEKLPDSIKWNVIETLAKQHGLFGILVDGVEKLPQTTRPPLTIWLRWIGEVQLEEARYNQQWNEACKMAHLFHQNNIRTYVLKGIVVSECYSKPEHRVSCDVDCFLMLELDGSSGSNGSRVQEYCWEKGNQVIENAGFEVEKVFYKNSTFRLSGLMVENHRFLTPFRGNKTLRRLEVYLQSELKGCSRSSNSSSGSRFEGTELWRPPVMVSALFLIEHAYSHFLHEGLTWRHVLDWVMFSRRYKSEIDWNEFETRIDEFGFRKFYDVFNEIGQDAFGNDSSRIRELEKSTNNSQLATDSKPSTLNAKLKARMIDDIWEPLDVHDSVRGGKGKLALVGNTWRARWKYHYFTEISWLTALWIQAKGYLFEKNPKLG